MPTSASSISTAQQAACTVASAQPECRWRVLRWPHDQASPLGPSPEQQADDVHRLLSALGDGPAHVFGSSGGAVVELALVTGHPGQVRTLVAHEPPVIELLPDREQLRAQIEDIYDTYRADGADKAMAKFMAHAGLGEAPGARYLPGRSAWSSVRPRLTQLGYLVAAGQSTLDHGGLPGIVPAVGESLTGWTVSADPAGSCDSVVRARLET
jgi:pimeloyl-ACP methyl ester carboxylesterase